MAAENSFDIVSNVDPQEVKNAVSQAEKEVGDQLHAATVHLFERALTLIETRAE